MISSLVKKFPYLSYALRVTCVMISFLLLLFLVTAEFILAATAKFTGGWEQTAQILTSVLAPILLMLLLACSRFRLTRVATVPLIALFTLYYGLYIVTSAYRIIYGVSLDPYFIWFNRSEVVETVSKVAGGAWIWFGLLALLVLWGIGWTLFYRSVVSMIQRHKPWQALWPVYVLIFLGIMMIGRVGLIDNRPEIYRFVANAASRHGAETEQRYLELYRSELDRQSNLHASATVDVAKLPNIVILKLESLNAANVNSEITPTMMRIAQEGLFFPRVVSQAVNTIRAEEVYLCSILPSLKEPLIYHPDFSFPECLPNVLSTLGYETHFFKSGSLEFSGTNSFMRSTGFEFLHEEDVMKPADLRDPWGYREDIFYNRVGEYVATRSKRPQFIYVAVGTANHYPFALPTSIHGDIQAGLPHPNTKDFQETFQNSTFVQDQYLQTALDWLETSGLRDNSYVLITGDHPFPIAKQYEESLFQHFAHEGVFLTSAVLLPPRNMDSPITAGTTFPSYASHADLAPTILDLLDVAHDPMLGVSLLPTIQDPAQSLDRCIVAVQPFSDRYISLVRYPDKKLFNLFKGTIETYDLQDDPQGLRPIESRSIVDADLDLLSACMPSSPTINTAAQ